jgi:hypothetical protein
MPLPPIQKQTLKHFDITDLTGGWNDSANQDTLSDNQLSDGRNVDICRDQTIDSRGGYVVTGNFLGSTTKILGLHEYYKPSTATRKLLAVYDTDAYVYGTSWVGAGITLTTNKPAWFTDYLDRAYMTNKGSTAAGALGVTHYDGTSWTQVTGFPVAAATSSDICAGLTVYKSRLIGWNTTNQPKRVYYSNANAHTIGTLNYFDLDEDVQVCVPLMDYLLCFTEHYIYRIGDFMLSGTTFEPKSLQPLATSHGCIAPKSAVRIGQQVYFLSRVGLMVTNGAEVVNLSEKRIPGYFESTASQSMLTSAAAGADGVLYRLAISTDGSTNNEVVTYDTQLRAFYPRGTTVAGFSHIVSHTISGTTRCYGGSDTDGTIYQFGDSNGYDEAVLQSTTTGKDTNSPIDAASGAVLRMAQSFTPSRNGELTKVMLNLAKNAGTTTDLTVRIETDNAGVPSGTLVTNGSATLTAFTSTSFLWYSVAFSTAPVLDAGTTYWLVVQHATEGTGNSQYYWGSDASSPAGDGNAATYSAGAWAATAGTDMLHVVYVKTDYEKYLVTKGYALGTPQLKKIIKRLFVEMGQTGDFTVNVGINTDLYDGFNEQNVNVGGDSYVRGDGTRGAFTRGTVEKISTFLPIANLRGRRIKLRVYNTTAEQPFSFYGATINFRTRPTLR